MISFSRQVKNELVRYSTGSRCCALAELEAFMQISGTLIINKKTISLVLQAQSASVARRLFSLFKFCFGLSPTILFCRRKQLRKNSVFQLKVANRNDSLRVLQELGFLAENPESGRPVLNAFAQNRSAAAHGTLKERCCQRAYLRGCFLAGGSISNPSTTYHLEIVAPYHHYAQNITESFIFFNLGGRCFQRKGGFVVYLKGAEEIGEFLRIVSAHKSLLNFENIRIVKGVRNRINRLVNCETANLTKTVVASQDQISNIRLLEKKMGLKNISPSLLQVARLRLSFPEATLQELGEMATPPLSKSSINHRLRRINALARKIREGDGDKKDPGRVDNYK